MAYFPPDHAVRRWFSGLVENSFQTRIGLCDPPVLDYLVDLLIDFIHVERIHLLADGSNRHVEDVAEMLSRAGPASDVDEPRLREIHRHIGDYTLFWTGVYPENLRRLHRRHDRDDLLSYFDQGKRSYAIACRLTGGDMHPSADVLRTLSDQFEECVYGLALVRKSWEDERGGTGRSPTVLWA